MGKVLLSTVLFGVLFICGCNTKMFVSKQDVINRMKGIAVFVDRSEVINTQSGDVFVDSLIPDFFIPYSFSKSIIQQENIIEALSSADGKKAAFFYLKGDCKEGRNSSIAKDAFAFILKEPIDNYIKSYKIFLVPVEFSFVKSSVSREYLEISKEILLRYSDKVIRLQIDQGYLDVLRMDVLEYQWE
jgi:hypothetical protein